MRKAISKNGFTLNIVAGMHVVILGMDLKKEDCKGLMGFAIHRTDHDEEEAYWLKGMKTFEQTDPGFHGQTLQQNLAIITHTVFRL
jgi:hypothetical protein